MDILRICFTCKNMDENRCGNKGEWQYYIEERNQNSDKNGFLACLVKFLKIVFCF